MADGMVTLDGEDLAAVQARCSRLLGVLQAIRTGGCIVCSPTLPLRTCWYTSAGQTEYEMSGCCEKCFDSFRPDEKLPQLTEVDPGVLKLQKGSV